MRAMSGVVEGSVGHRDRLKWIERYCLRSDLSTYDPYDVWKTRLGFACKDYFNRHRLIGLVPAAIMALFDCLINDRMRLFYRRQEYPIVRALAALSLLNLYRVVDKQRYLDCARTHLEWLRSHRCSGYHGIGWGIGFDYAVSRELRHDANTPFATVTPYCLEAFAAFEQITGTADFRDTIRGVYDFYERDLVVMEETEEYMATSYGPLSDRVVVNAVSYTMYAYSLLLSYVPACDRAAVMTKIEKLYGFLRRTQRVDGAWWYSPEGTSFVDCFHSCITLKNIIKTNTIVPLEVAQSVIDRGYRYITTYLWDGRTGLCRRFSVRNKPGIIRYDLYDSAEALNLAVLMRDEERIRRLEEATASVFCDGDDVYSKIDFAGVARNRNTLRWAVMPYMYALSQRLLYSGDCT